MTITAYNQKRSGIQTEITVKSDLLGAVYYHWYVDGEYHGPSTSRRRSFALPAGDAIQVQVIDTVDPNFDADANAPVGYSGKYTVYWTKSLDAGVAHYRVEQKKEADPWTVLGTVNHDNGTWQYRLTTKRLVDLASYQWRVIPVDFAGNDGTALTLGPETVVRSPDAPDVTATYSAVDSKVAFAEIV